MRQGYICPWCRPEWADIGQHYHLQCRYCKDQTVGTCPACTCPLCTDPEGRAELDALAAEYADLADADQADDPADAPRAGLDFWRRGDCD